MPISTLDLTVAGTIGLIVGGTFIVFARAFHKKTGSHLGLKQCPNCGNAFNSILLRKCMVCQHPLQISEGNPSFRDRVSLALGKTIIVGLTYEDARGSILEQKQLHGKIVRIDSEKGIEILLHQSDEIYYLPPRLALLKPAPAGEYRLRSTGEVIINPDFTSDWIVNRSQ